MKPSQVDRVLAAAQSFRGVSQVDFLGPQAVDGGAPITRLAARIQDCEARGYRFQIIGWRNKCRVYRLTDEAQPDVDGGRGPNAADGAPAAAPPVPKSTAAVSAEQVPTLFEMAPDSAHWKLA